jgi:hypothetical protein
MWADRASCRILLAAALASACPRSAYAEGPPPLPPAESPGAPIAEPTQGHTEEALIVPRVTHPPWTGREAIWGGVGLVIAGVATLIVVAPALCTSGLFGNGGTGPGTTSTGPSPRTPCWEATIGGGAGGAVVGVILLAVGETQRAAYKEWLRAHPMFSGLSLGPNSKGAALSWSISF